MRAVGAFITGHRLAAAMLLCAVTALLGWRASLLEEDLSFETLYLSDDPNIEFSERFAENFENVNDMVAIALTDGDIFTPELLSAVKRMTRRMEKLTHVDVVYSLANIRLIQATEDGLDVGGFMDEVPETAAQAKALEERASGYELFRRRLLSSDGKYTAIVVQTSDVVGMPADRYAAELFNQIRDEDPQVRDIAAQGLAELGQSAVEAVRPDRPDVVRLIGNLRDPDKRSAAVKELGRLGPDFLRTLTVEDRRVLIADIETIVEEEIPSGYRHYITGNNVVERDYAEILRKDKMIFQPLTAVILLVAFYFFFFSIRDTLIAFTSLMLAAVCALGMVQLIGGVIDIINSVIFMMVLVVGTSDAIHMIHGFYQQWRPGEGRDAGRLAAARMVESVGFACLMTSATTACGFVSLYFARIGTVSRFGLNMAVAVIATYAVSVVSVTLMMSFVKKVPKWRQERERRSWLDRFLKMLAILVVDRRRLAVLVCLVFMACLAFGYPRLRVETHAVAEVGPESTTKVNMLAMNNLSGFLGFEVSVRSLGDRALIEPDMLRKVDTLARYLENEPETIHTWSVVDYVKEMNRAASGGGEEHYTVPDTLEAVDQFLLLYTFSQEGLKEINGLLSQDRKWLRIVSRVYDVGAKPYLRLRDRVEAMGRDLFPEGDVEVRVTSEMSLIHVAMDSIVRDLTRSIGFAFVLVAVLMAFSLRSIRLGMLAIVPNVMPVLATLGFMGLVGIDLRVGTIVVFSLGFGIAVDDTIHYLLRYRQERAKAGSYREGILRTHASVGKPMVLTSLALIAGFLGNTPATFKSISHMGILNSFIMAAAIVADLLITPLLLRVGERKEET